MNRQNNESFISFCLRATQALKNSEITYCEWAKIISNTEIYGDETLRRVSNVFEKFLEKVIEDKLLTITDEELKKFFHQQQSQFILEKKKIQTENLQLQEQ